MPRTRAVADVDEGAEADRPRWFALRTLGWSHRDAVAFTVAVCSVLAMLINALFMQTGPHPAPMFTASPAMPGPVSAKGTELAHRSARVEPGSPNQTAGQLRSGPEVVADIQRELAARGFFDGVVDGRHGPRTDAAVRSFALAAGMNSSLELNEGLLAAIRRSNARLTKTTVPAGTAAASSVRPASIATGASTPRPPVPIRHDQIAELLAPTKRVLAVQRVLAEFGYGQIRPTGVIDGATRSAIEKFERERNLPVTGAASDRLVRELAAVTGRQVE